MSVQGEQYVQSRQRVWGEFRAHRKFQTDREEEERKGGREEGRKRGRGEGRKGGREEERKRRTLMIVCIDPPTDTNLCFSNLCLAASAEVALANLRLSASA